MPVKGPLSGFRMIEMAGLGPAPFAGMLLADMGAEVVRIDRIPKGAGPGAADSRVEAPRDDADLLNRGKRSVAMDLKSPPAIETLLTMLDHADALIEGFRPGVMEGLGLGPEVALGRNPRLVYGRMTGWGQGGPLARSAGHDINYISVAGLLAHVGRAGEAPVPPLNLGDFGAGSMFLAFGVVTALLERSRSQRGQVVDASIVDGAAVLMSALWSMYHAGLFDIANRGTNMLDSGSYFYDTYRCADGQYVSIAAAEPKFYATFLRVAGLADDPSFAQTLDRAQWPRMKAKLSAVFATRTRAEWVTLFEGTDACVAPVLRMDEAAEHPHNVARGTFENYGGVTQPAPSPRFSRTPGRIAGAPPVPGAHTVSVLREWGLPAARVDELVRLGAISIVDRLNGAASRAACTGTAACGSVVTSASPMWNRRRRTMKALVIGGAGPTGPHLLQGLLERGYETTMLHRGVHEPPGLPDLPHIHADPHFPETLRDAVGDRHFDVVVATYGRLTAISEVLSPHCDHLVCVSGVPVYRGFIEPEGSRPWGMKVLADEDSPKSDETERPAKFAKLILDAERSVFAAAEKAGAAASTVRYPQIYGPRNIVPWEWTVLKRVMDGRAYMILPDDGLWIISRCAARNAAEVVLRIVDNRDTATGQAYNCADEDQFTLRQWAQTVAEIAGRQLEFIGIPSLLAPSAVAEWLAPGARPHMIVSNQKAKRDLGYRDVVTARVALEETVDWLRRNPVTSQSYPMYSAKFDYEMEDRLIDAYGRAVDWVQQQAPDQAPDLAHPMPHPKRPSLTTDERGR